MEAGARYFFSTEITTGVDIMPPSLLVYSVQISPL